MRVLVVAPVFPWPLVTGARMRVHAFLTASAELGPVDFFAWVDRPRDDCALPDGAPVDRLWVSVREPPRLSAARRVAALARREPLTVAARPAATGRRELAAFRRHHYDATIVWGLPTWAAFADLLPPPVLLDVNDLEDTKTAQRLASRGDAPESTAAAVRSWLASVQGRADARAWRAVQRRATASAAVTAVCSELDARRLGDGRVAIVPNGYDLPALRAGDRRDLHPSTPTVTFVGSMSYPPNVDAARHLVADILPLLAALVPDVRVRIVGRPSPAVTALADPPRVVVTGFVDDIVDELARADVLAVPLRYGGGTRIKILEAFAHRVPVVATTVGGEGLAVAHDRHLLIADDPAAFAEACARVIAEASLRARLVDEGERLFTERYQWRAAQVTIAELLRSVARGGAAAG